MRSSAVLALGVLLVRVGAAVAEPTQREKEGALHQKQDPSADLELQKDNLKRLRENARDDRKAGNRVGAWAAEWDARHVEKLIRNDERALGREAK